MATAKQQIKTKAAAPAPAPEPEVQEEVAVVAGAGLFPTPAIKMPVQKPDAHRATISGVTDSTGDSGYTSINIGLTSLADGETYRYTVFPPQAFVTDFAAALEAAADPDALEAIFSKEIAEGAFQSEFDKFASTIGNAEGKATLQQIQGLAAEQGRDSTSLGLELPSSFEEYISALNQVLTTTQVVFTRRPKKSANPAYDGRLQVNSIRNISTWDNPRDLRGYERVGMDN